MINHLQSLQNINDIIKNHNKIVNKPIKPRFNRNKKRAHARKRGWLQKGGMKKKYNKNSNKKVYKNNVNNVIKFLII